MRRSASTLWSWTPSLSRNLGIICAIVLCPLCAPFCVLPRPQWQHVGSFQCEKGLRSEAGSNQNGCLFCMRRLRRSSLRLAYAGAGICMKATSNSNHAEEQSDEHSEGGRANDGMKFISEGSQVGLRVSPTLAAKPGSTAGFFNRKRRIGRDFVVLSVARWLEKLSSSDGHDGWTRPARLLDAMCASGIQGLRVAAEAPALAKASGAGGETPELQVVLNDADSEAAALAEENKMSSSNNSAAVSVSQRPAQALLHEESFEVCVLDPFGSCVPFLDAALARAPHQGLLEVCATDLGALYGSRPAVTRRHYSADLQPKRPPCYRERGVRLLLAAAAQAAGRQGRGVEPVMSVSTEHVVLLSLRVLRGARAADSSAAQVRRMRICRRCSAAAVSPAPPPCSCAPTHGAGADAAEEGPLWVGALHDAEEVAALARLARLPQAASLLGEESRALLAALEEEARVQGWFYRRPQTAAAGGRTPKLSEVLAELQRRGLRAARTHMDPFALKTEASPHAFALAVRAAASAPPPPRDRGVS